LVKRLASHPELLDGQLDAGTVAANFRDLTRINRRLGGSRLSLAAVSPLLHGRGPTTTLTLVDIGTGTADIPISLVRALKKRRRPRLEITATDIRPEIITLAQDTVAAAGSSAKEIQVRAGRLEDELTQSFDIVHFSLVLHHLEPATAATLLGEASRVAREAVIVNDLDRAWRWYVGAWLMTRVLTTNAYTRNDAPLSVRRAYRPVELATMARAVGLRPIALYWARPAYRYALVLVPAAPRPAHG